MILFVTAYDPSTLPNLAVASRLTDTRVQLLSEDATRTDLWQTLAQNPGVPLIAMSHGRRRFLRAQHGRSPHAIEVEDVRSLGVRRVFAWACQTSAELGRKAADAGVIWLGFPVKIAAPPDDEQLQELLAGVLQHVVNDLAAVTNEESCRALMDRLVDEAGRVLDTANIYDSGTQQCFEQFQLRLEAWLPGRAEPVRPTRAPATRFDDLDPDERPAPLNERVTDGMLGTIAKIALGIVVVGVLGATLFSYC